MKHLDLSSKFNYMKPLLILVLMSVLFSSCVTTESFTFTEEEMKNSGFSEQGWSILKDGKAIAKIESMEWEFFEEKLYQEISVTLIDYQYSNYDEMKMLMKYIHTKHPKSKIEINEDPHFKENQEGE